jgi:hypothetical protein
MNDRFVCPRCGGWVEVDPNTGEATCCDTCDYPNPPSDPEPEAFDPKDNRYKWPEDRR